MRKLLKGGTVISAEGSRLCDVLIDGERIIKVSENIEDANAKVIDVSGKLLFPGFIDAHTHFELHVSSTVTADDFYTGTKAAISGGTTTIIDYATQYEGETLHEAIENWHKKSDGISSCDYAFHLAISDWKDEIEDELESIVKEGVSTFKLYMTYEGMYLDDRNLYEIIKKLHSLGAFAGVHCENKFLIEGLVKEFKKAKKLEAKYHPKSRPDTVEAEAIDRLMKICELADSEIMVVHLTSKKGFDEIMKARAKGVRVFAETCPQYLILDDSVYEKENFESAKYVISPPIRKKEDSKVLWRALKNGDIQTIATDHCSFNFEQKKAGMGDFTKIPNGMPGVEARAYLLMDEAVKEHDFTYSDMCRLLSTNAAKLYGMYPKKGVIAEGSDADIVVWDKDETWTMTLENQVSNTDYCPFENRKIVGRAKQVYLRGELVASDGKVLKENTGKYIRRGLPCHI